MRKVLIYMGVLASVVLAVPAVQARPLAVIEVQPAQYHGYGGYPGYGWERHREWRRHEAWARWHRHEEWRHHRGFGRW